MKTHEHALISLAYAGGLALLAGQGFTDPGIYLASLAGGEILDFIDHPLYHLVYRRKKLQVVKARELLVQGKFKEAIRFLNQVEDERGFKGLLLHNTYALALVTLAGVGFSLFLQGSIYWFIFWGAMLLHMLTDIYGDFIILGHIDNWLWVIPESWLERWGKLGNRLVISIMLAIAVVLLGFIIISFRWIWQSVHPTAYAGLLEEAKRSGKVWLAYAPLAGLGFYQTWLVMICAAAAHKYRLELRQNKCAKRVPFYLGSMKLINQCFRNRARWCRQYFERVLISMQEDQAVWIVFLAFLTSLTLLGLTWLHLDSDLLVFLIPIFFASFFGTFIHTSMGELGGVLGILLAFFLNLLLARLGLQQLWPVSRGYLLFGSAALAWSFGLIGSILVKGHIRMSVTVFSMHICIAKNVSNDYRWLPSIVKLAREGLRKGYKMVHEQLYGDSSDPDFIHYSEPDDINQVDLIVTPYEGSSVFDTDYYHLQVTDSYSPVLRELAYVLCDNYLMSRSDDVKGKHGILPVMPRQRRLETNYTMADMHWSGGAYHWHSLRRPLVLRSVPFKDHGEPEEPCLTLYKTWAEIVDHMFTRSSTFKTDLLIFPPSNQSQTITISGLTREVTSTKEYATVEAEAYAGAAMDAILKDVNQRPEFTVVRHTSARLIFPRVSIYDQKLVDPTLKSAALPSDSGDFSKKDIAHIHKCLDVVSGKNILISATSNMGKQLAVMVIQVIATALIATVLSL